MAAASATSLSAAFSSSVTLNSLRRISSPSSTHRLRLPTSRPPLSILSGPPPKPSPPRADPSDIGFDTEETEEISAFSNPEPARNYPRPPELLEEPTESEEDIERAFEEIYGPAYNGVSHLGNDVYATAPKRKSTLDLNIRKAKVRDGFEERVIQVRRVTKVVKGGKLMSFRAVVVVGDKQGNVGVGVAQAKEVVIAVEKAVFDARKHIISVPMTKYNTFPHRAEAYSGAAKVMLRPAAPGTGIIAGGSVKIVLEMVGVENALGKQLGSDNALNNARATIEAMLKMRSFSEVAEQRRIPMEQLWQ